MFDAVGEGVTWGFAELEPGVLEGGGGENGDIRGVATDGGGCTWLCGGIDGGGACGGGTDCCGCGCGYDETMRGEYGCWYCRG